MVCTHIVDDIDADGDVYVRILFCLLEEWCLEQEQLQAFHPMLMHQKNRMG